VKETATTELTRRAVLGGFIALFAKPARSEPAWPNRPITLVHGFATGGPTDTVARIVAEGLSRRLGQQVVVDPRPGASGTTAAGQVARAAHDGYTLIAIPGGHASAAALYRRLPYQTIDDFSMISMTSEYPFVFVTYSDHTIQSMDDLIGTARLRQTPLLYGSPGIGSLHHLSVELLAKMANIQLQHVPYRGSAQAVIDLIGKRIDFMIDPPTLMLEFVRDGRLRALGTTGAARFFSLPNVPTVSEAALPGYVVTSWQGLAGPAGITLSIIGRLNREVATVLAEPEIVERLRMLGNDPKSSSPDALKARIVADVAKWTDIVETAHIERI
jgi:tripartite-type tricarboxylate transporter receptor subunit TctC